MSAPIARSSRIEARIAPDALAIVKRAAELQGRSVSEFVVASAQSAAYRVIEASHVLRLSLADQRTLAEAILAPPEPNAALERAASAYRDLVRSSD